MRNHLKTVILACVILGTASGSIPLRAMDVSVGATGWYAWWKPMWDQVPFFFRVPGTTFDMTARKTEMDPAFLYGPMVNVSFLDNWSLASSFVWGNQYRATFHSEYTMHIPSSADQVAEASEKAKSIKKYDSDTTLSYRLSKMIKLFAGYKYQGYSYTLDFNGDFVGFSAPYAARLKLESRGMGPGAGIGFTFPLWDNIFLVYNISGLYLRTTWTYSDYHNTSTFFPDAPPDVHFTSYGYNTGANVAYYISGAHTTLTLGFRYQYLYYRTSDPDKDRTNDKFYGVTFAAVYTFSIFK